jgi:hypothetical protein
VTTPQVLELVPGMTIGRLHRWAHRGLINSDHVGRGTGNPATWTAGDVIAARFLLVVRSLGVTLSSPGVVAAAHLLADATPTDLVGAVIVVQGSFAYIRRPDIDWPGSAHLACVVVSLDPLLEGLR